jgi:Ca-activated chloride channel family protein
MAENRRRNIFIALVLFIIAIALLLVRCSCEKPSRGAPPTAATQSRPIDAAASTTGVPAVPEPDEVLTPATLTAPQRVTAGAVFSVAWTGPDNRDDYVTIVRGEARDNNPGNYQLTKQGKPLELTAPIEPGAHELRYVTGRSHTILGRAPVEVVPAGATLDAPAEVVLGAPFSVAWTGPNNKGDYITIVAKDAPDAHYGSYTDADKPSPQTLTAPTLTGDAELRYVTGQGKKVLSRRTIRVVMPSVSVSAPSEAIAGTTVRVTWTGPNNAGDYITVVAIEIPDGQYQNYTVTSNGSPLDLLTPIMAGGAELRYMTGQGNKVLARRPIKIVAAKVNLSAPAEGAAGAAVNITWTGPSNPGDYITVVARSTPDGQYGDYTVTAVGSPLSVKLPKTAGDGEVRYMTGQGNKVLARIPIKVTP